MMKVEVIIGVIKSLKVGVAIEIIKIKHSRGDRSNFKDGDW